MAFNNNVSAGSVIASVNLPAGKYLVSGKVSLGPMTSSGANGNQECGLRADGEALDTSYVRGPQYSLNSCAVLATVELNTASAVELTVFGAFSETVQISKGVVTAIKVGTIN